MGRAFRLVVCALVLWPSAALAQRFDDFGVRAQGMGGAFVAVADDASATWWNPAGLATGLTFVDLQASVLKGGDGSIALAFPSLGLSYYRLRISQIQPSSTTTATTPSDRQDNGAVGSAPPSADFVLSEFGATFGQSITQHFVVGTTVKVVNALNDTKADLDVGALVAFGFVRVGVTVRDVLEPTFGVAPDAFELTRRARAGAAFIASAHGWVDRAVFAVDADLTTSPIAGRDERELAGGAELWMRGRRIGVRGGGGTNTAAGGGSFGAFGLTLVPFPRLNVDGAVQRGSDSTRDRWSLGVRLTF